MRDLFRHIVPQQVIHWDMLGIELGLKEHLIATIASNNPDDKETCYLQILAYWLKNDRFATWSKLEDAVKKIKRLSTSCPVSTVKEGNHSY